ncbi:hypothetical protein [Azospirillum brasilense]|uniref:Lipoprotein n=1 Tax=Azospirillum brasilense TaxID=192 RepID=A0A235HFU0_AZOBR|nr:hypothetical protein [Azospirillum brasilense]OYD84562.1 hypothetical protein CHT98_08835 [Azospirillum brasilense]
MDRRRDRNIGTPARKSPRALAFASLGVLALTGCSGLGGGSNTAADAALACPKVSIVRDLAEVTQFRNGGGRDLTDVTSRAALADYSGNCDYTSDGVTVNVNVFLIAERGPAMQGNTANYRYFVAVAKPGEETPTTKTEFDTSVTFDAGKLRSGSREELAPKIPLPKDANGKDWKIFLGFQLTPDQLAFNRAQMKQ